MTTRRCTHTFATTDAIELDAGWSYPAGTAIIVRSTHCTKCGAGSSTIAGEAPTPIATAYTGHVLGVTYRSHYWQQAYTVTAIVGDSVRVLWEDGRTTTHCTQLDARDAVLNDGTPDSAYFAAPGTQCVRAVGIARCTAYVLGSGNDCGQHSA